eukprot:5867023-Amphidinium_carterae.1
MAGLLLARGLLKCDPTGLFYGPSLPWLHGLGPRDVINAVFQHDWNTTKVKLLLVHVDELALLSKELEHCPEEQRMRMMKDLVNPLSEYNTGEPQGKVLGIITHTCPTPCKPMPTEIPVKDCTLMPLNFGDSVKLITDSDATELQETDQYLQNVRAVNACGGHPTLLQVLKAMMKHHAYHMGSLFNAEATKLHKAAIRSDDNCLEVARLILMQEATHIDLWSPMLHRGLLSIIAVTDDRRICKLACAYPMLVNMLIRQNDALKALIPPTHMTSKFSYDCFEVVTALKIAAEYGSISAFLLRADMPLLAKLREVKGSEAQKCCVFLSRSMTEEGIEGAGLNKQADGIV